MHGGKLVERDDPSAKIESLKLNCRLKNGNRTGATGVPFRTSKPQLRYGRDQYGTACVRVEVQYGNGTAPSFCYFITSTGHIGAVPFSITAGTVPYWPYYGTEERSVRYGVRNGCRVPTFTADSLSGTAWTCRNGRRFYASTVLSASYRSFARRTRTTNRIRRRAKDARSSRMRAMLLL